MIMISVTYANGSLATNQVFSFYRTKLNPNYLGEKVKLIKIGDINVI